MDTARIDHTAPYSRWKNILGTSLFCVGAIALALFFLTFIVAIIALLWSAATTEEPLWARIINIIFMLVVSLILLIGCAIVASVAGFSFGISVLVAIGLAFTMPWSGKWEDIGYVLLFLMVAGGIIGPGWLLREAHQYEVNSAIEKEDAERRERIFGQQHKWATRFGDGQKQLESHGNFDRSEETFQEFGIPGEGLLSAIDEHMDRGPALSGAAGEKKTAEIVRSLAEEFPGMSLLNGLKVQEDEGWDVDHAVIYADLVIYLDSKNYATADYAWVGKSIERQPSNGAPGRPNHLQSAAEKISTDLRTGLTTKSAVVIHPSTTDASIRIIGDPEPSDRPRLMNADDFTAWLRESLEEHAPGGDGPLKGVAAYVHQCSFQELRVKLPRYIQDRHWPHDA